MTKIDTSTEAVEALLKDVTPVKPAQFHPNFCAEAKDAQPKDWDTSHDLSVILPDGSRYRIGTFRHADDALFDQVARELVPALLAERDALKAEVERLKAKATGVWNEAIDEAAGLMSVGGRHTISARTGAILALKRPVKGENHE